MEEFYAITSKRSKEYIRQMPYALQALESLTCFVLTTCRFKKKRAFETLYPKASPAAIDFLTKTLTCESPWLKRKARVRV